MNTNRMTTSMLSLSPSGSATREFESSVLAMGSTHWFCNITNTKLAHRVEHQNINLTVVGSIPAFHSCVPQKHVSKNAGGGRGCQLSALALFTMLTASVSEHRDRNERVVLRSVDTVSQRSAPMPFFDLHVSLITEMFTA